MAKLRIELCPETGICSIIKDNGTKVDMMPGEVADLKEASGDPERSKAVLAEVDASFSASLDSQELSQISDEMFYSFLTCEFSLTESIVGVNLKNQLLKGKLMELSLLMKLRIAVVMVFSGLVLGVLGFSILGPEHPEAAVTLFGGNITIIDTIVYAALCFAVTIIAYLLAYPYGMRIAPLAVATGLTVVACRSGEMMTLLNVNHTLTQRIALYSALKWEGFYWLLPLAAAWCGLLVSSRFMKQSPPAFPEAEHDINHKLNKKLAIIIAVAATIVIANFAIGIFAQDVRMFDRQVGSVVGQPATSQIAFAVITAFAIAAFVVKRFLGQRSLV